ncbi:PIR Superfamily Protein [Plasmodium ovale wallikeri]|uniref:PIR Superfamily Protein n=1 Tax=Plasmodium ovale wallikeri TaxID=864142 RepID=A0A1A9AM72_PLAOA|nr:PIR Superfamily Protein [Plasmodium ovale wallikeri]SBT57751.1 PIR Superfamily Protein [Plasmodium ovale wallikeri]
MSGYSVSKCFDYSLFFILFLLIQTSGEGDLPAKDFDDKWNTATKFLEFSNPVNLKSTIDDIEQWINNFDKQLLMIYDVNTLGDLRDIREKRCRDLNYYINYILHYIPTITNNTKKDIETIQKFKTYLNAIFDKWEKFSTTEMFKCKRVAKEYTYKMDLIKLLDDYCENRNAFKKKLAEYDETTCCKYAKHVSEIKRSFHDYILRHTVSKQEDDFHIEDNCTLKRFGETFPNVICTDTGMSEIKTDELPTQYGHIYSHGTYPEDSIHSSPTKIAVTSVTTLLGVCLSGLYLYRHSFMGNRLSNSKNKNIFSHDDIYDDVTKRVSESPLQHLDIPEESNRFYISYDPMYN